MDKSARKTAHIIRHPKANGGALLSAGQPGNKGGTGRPPDAFRELCRELACSGSVAAAAILQLPDHPAYIGALKWATEHGYGKPKETVEHSGNVIHTHQIWAFGAQKVEF